MRTLLLALLVLLTGCYSCGRKKEEMPAPDDVVAKLLPKFELYLKLSRDVVAKHDGWVTGGCDDTLFTGLRGTYAKIDLTKAIKSPGEWTRRNLALGDCYEMRHPGTNKRLSESRISRDMMIGAGAWMLANDRDDLAADVLDYAKKHGDHMGDGDTFRTKLSASLKATFLKIADRRNDAEHVPVSVGGEIDYERHLAAWHLIIRADAEGGMRQGYYQKWIENAARLQPHNPLYQYLKAAYVTGDYSDFVAKAMDEKYFPNDRLPSSKEICAEWVIQRDMGKDWKPCPKEHKPEIYSGSDWLAVVARVVKRTF